MDQLNRLVEIMSEMLHEQRETNKRLERLEIRLEKLEVQFERMESQMAKNTAAVGELRISVMRLADEILVVHDHERRISELEKKVA